MHSSLMDLSSYTCHIKFCLLFCLSLNVTGLVKRGLIHASDFATLMSHNFVIKLLCNTVYLHYTGINSILISPRSQWEEYICPDCDELMNNPVLTSCDHRMCHKCFNKRRRS